MDKITLPQALQGLVVALGAALVGSGALSGQTESLWQPVAVAVVTLIGCFGVRSLRKPRQK